MTELDDLIADWTRSYEAGELLDLLHEAGVPAGKIYTASDMFNDPHFAARDAIVKLAHPDFGEIPMHGVFPKLSETPGGVRHPGPALGQHNHAIYGGLLGLTEAEQTAFTERGVI